MYAKVFASLWDGTLGQQWEAWAVFVYLLANCDVDGIVDQTPEAIAARSGLPIEVVEKGLRTLEQPDRRSRSAAEAGRRLVAVDNHRDWGWRIVNYGRYRGVRDSRSRREYQRQWVANKRLSTDVDRCRPESTQAEAEAEADVEAKKNLTPLPKLAALAVGESGGSASLNGASRRKPVKARLPHGEPEGFLPWYESYPRHVARLDASRAYRQMIHSQQDRERLTANTRLWTQRWFAEDREEHHVPYPASFLRAGTWQDPPEED